jgi:hypothetical protein
MGKYRVALVIAFAFAAFGTAHSQSPRPGYPTPKVSQVRKLCTGYDMTLDQWNFVSPYLLCYSVDKYTNGVNLFEAQGAAPGKFVHIKGGGGAMDVGYLVQLGVPSSIASRLVSGLHR